MVHLGLLIFVVIVMTRPAFFTKYLVMHKSSNKIIKMITERHDVHEEGEKAVDNARREKVVERC